MALEPRTQEKEKNDREQAPGQEDITEEEEESQETNDDSNAEQERATHLLSNDNTIN